MRLFFGGSEATGLAGGFDDLAIEISEGVCYHGTGKK
jgi:hypothetical protein